MTEAAPTAALPDDALLASILEEAAVGDRSRFPLLVESLAPWLQAALERMGLESGAASTRAKDVLREIWIQAPSYDSHLGPPSRWGLSLARGLGLPAAGSDWAPMASPGLDLGRAEARALASLSAEQRDRLERLWYRGPRAAVGDAHKAGGALAAYAAALDATGGS